MTAASVKPTVVPSTFEEAIREAEDSAFLKEVLGEELLSLYVVAKKKAAEELEKDPEGYAKKQFERL